VAALLAGARSEKVPVALLLIDVDQFKSINDTYGHEAGDLVLCRIAHRLQRWEGATCAVGRHGGEEFALLIAASAALPWPALPRACGWRSPPAIIMSRSVIAR
jgi:diguanylate cyclase (GGDEF)-like protein